VNPNLVQKLGGIQIQRVALAAARQPFHRPDPEHAEALGVARHSSKGMEKTRQGRLVARTPNAEQLRHQQIASKVGHMREFASLAQDALQKSHRLFLRE
jgi:hypothetical protein